MLPILKLYDARARNIDMYHVSDSSGLFYLIFRSRDKLIIFYCLVFLYNNFLFQKLFPTNFERENNFKNIF